MVNNRSIFHRNTGYAKKCFQAKRYSRQRITYGALQLHAIKDLKDYCSRDEE